MKTPRFLAVGLISVLSFVCGGQRAAAELPNLTEQPWIGFFAVHETKKFQFGITAQGKINLIPLGDKGDPVAGTLHVPIEIAIEEVFPDGKIVVKQIRTDTLESPDAATDKLEKVTLRGKITGDAAFEAVFEQSRGMMAIGGRITDPGTAIKNPLRFTVRARIQPLYTKDKTFEKKDLKIFEKKVESDRIDIKYTDGQRKKQTFADPVTASSTEISGPGIAGLEAQIYAYKGKRFLFLASPGSAITLSNTANEPLHKGFQLIWTPDPAKDKDGKARFSIDVK